MAIMISILAKFSWHIFDHKFDHTLTAIAILVVVGSFVLLIQSIINKIKKRNNKQ